MKLSFNKPFQAAKDFYQASVQKPLEQTGLHRKMIILLEKNKLQANWLITDPQTGESSFSSHGELNQLQPGEKDEVLVIVPGQEILLTQTPMPRLNTYRLQQALPYALEEQVLDDIDDLHFAPGPFVASARAEPQDLPVVVLKKELMEDWLNSLQQAGIQADALVPELFLLPYEENQWYLHLSKDRACLRTGLYSGLSTDPQSLEALLTLKLAESESKPNKLIIYQDKNIALSLKPLGLTIETQDCSPKQWLNLGAASLEQYPYLNLLQAPYLSARKTKIPEKNKKAWRLAALALGLWIGIIFLSKLGSWAILAHEHHHLQNMIEDTYLAQFPQSKAVMDPKSKMEATLKRTLAQSEKSVLFQWLGDIAKLSSAVRIQSLNFQNNQMTLDLTASSFSSLDEFILAMKSSGVEVKQQSANLAGNQVKAILVIEGKHA